MEVNYISNEQRVQAMSEELNKIAEQIKIVFPAFNLTDFYFAGGCLYCLWNDKEVKDYDIFCTNKKAIALLKKHFKLHPELVNIKTKNAYTVGKCQFVIKYVGAAPIEVGKFDFKHNCYWYDDTGVHDLFGWDYIGSNELKFNTARARDVLNILTRIPKFVGRDMEISQKEILDIIEVGTRPTKIFSERRSIKARRSGRSKY